MKFCTICSLCLLMLFPLNSVFAQDYIGEMGFYFDEEALEFCMDLGNFPTNGTFDLYLTLTNPTFDALHGFEQGHDFSGPAFFIGGAFTNPTALDVGHPDNMIAGFGEPTLMQAVNVLYRFTFFYVGQGDEEITWRLRNSHPSSNSLGLPSVDIGGDQILPIHMNPGMGDGITAIALPEGCTVATSCVTWDGMKALFK